MRTKRERANRKKRFKKRKKRIDVMGESMLGWGDAPILEQNVNSVNVCCGAAKRADFSMSAESCQ